MKPHEEEWTRHPSKAGFWIVNGAGDGGILLTVNGTEAHGVLAAAAPDMARALLANGYVRTSGDGLWHTDACNEMNDGGVTCTPSCEQARASLTKAGVIP